MKKLLLMTLAMLSLGAVAYAADGMNLAWVVCRTSANNLTPAQNDQSTFTAGVCDDPGQQFTNKRLVCSMKNGTTLNNWGGTTIQVNFYTGAGNPVPDFWQFGANGCRNGDVSAPGTSTNATNCSNPYRPGSPNNDPAGESEIFGIDESQVANGIIAYQSDHVRNTVAINLGPPSAVGGHLVNNLVIDGLQNDTCAGCAAPVCIELQFVKYFSTAESRTILATELRNWVVVNGGNGGSCSTAVPVRNTTWGQVKALYR